MPVSPSGAFLTEINQAMRRGDRDAANEIVEENNEFTEDVSVPTPSSSSSSSGSTSSSSSSSGSTSSTATTSIDSNPTPDPNQPSTASTTSMDDPHPLSDSGRSPTASEVRAFFDSQGQPETDQSPGDDLPADFGLGDVFGEGPAQLVALVLIGGLAFIIGGLADGL